MAIVLFNSSGHFCYLKMWEQLWIFLFLLQNVLCTEKGISRDWGGNQYLLSLFKRHLNHHKGGSLAKRLIRKSQLDPLSKCKKTHNIHQKKKTQNTKHQYCIPHCVPLLNNTKPLKSYFYGDLKWELGSYRNICKIINKICWLKKA